MITTNGQLYQWDVGRIIEVSHLATSTVSEIHVYNGTTDDAPVLILKKLMERLLQKYQMSYCGMTTI